MSETRDEIEIGQDHDAAARALSGHIGALEEIAYSLKALGIPAGRDMAMRLQAADEELRRMRSAYQEQIFLQVKEAEQATKNMMLAVLAVLPKSEPA